MSSLIKSIPNLIVNLPGYGNVDISKVHPKLIEHVLSGGTIPGVSKEAMDSVVKQIMQRVYAAAAQAQGRQVEPDIARTLPRNGLKPEKYLRPLSDMPESVVSDVMQGKPLPYLTTAQTAVVRVSLLTLLLLKSLAPKIFMYYLFRTITRKAFQLSWSMVPLMRPEVK